MLEENKKQSEIYYTQGVTRFFHVFLLNFRNELRSSLFVSSIHYVFIYS